MPLATPPFSMPEGTPTGDVILALAFLAVIAVLLICATGRRAPAQADSDEPDTRTLEQRAREAFDDLREW